VNGELPDIYSFLSLSEKTMKLGYRITHAALLLVPAILIFSAWIFFMGTLQLVTGLASMEDSDYFWIYILAGITFLSMGFVIINYGPRFKESIPSLVAIVLVLYSGTNLFLLIKRKKDFYES